ncbi:MAG: HIT domain-containing protein [Thermodesulfobacteriota bacterium]
MNRRDDCIFCKIAAGEIPCTRVFEDDRTLAFMDICPLNKGHLLVIPKEHFEHIGEIDPTLYGHLCAVICRLAHAAGKSLEPHGMNVMQLNGKAGNQVVPHVHVHLVPRWEGDGLTICAWEPVAGDKDEITAHAEKIKSKL